MSTALDIWLNTFTSQWTKSQYKSNVKMFVHFIYEEGDVFELADRYLEEKREDIVGIMKDVDRYWASTTKLVPKTRLNRMSGIKIFLRDNYVELSDNFWRKFGTRGMRPKPVSKETMIDVKQIRAILSHLRAVGTAVVMVCIATGARIGEILKIHLDDIVMDLDPPRVYLRAETTKNKQARVVFLTEEAREAINVWMGVRTHYLKNKRGPQKDLNDPRLFPFCHQNVYAFWYDVLRLVGLDQKDEKTGRWLVRIHGFRKRFRTLLATVIPVDIVETLMGHQGYQTESYRRHSEEDLASWYKKGCYILMLYTERAEIAKIAAQQEETNLALQQQLGEKDRQISEFSLQLAETTARLAHIEAILLDSGKKEKE